MTSRTFITCRELIDFLADYFEAGLTDSQSKAFDRHLAACPSCRAYLATYRKSFEAGKIAMRYDDSKNEDAPEDLIRAVLRIARQK